MSLAVNTGVDRFVVVGYLRHMIIIFAYSDAEVIPRRRYSIK